MKQNFTENRRSPTEDREAGFSLIEIMVTVLIVGIIAAMVTPVVFKYQRETAISTLKSDIRSNFPILYELEDSSRTFRLEESVRQELHNSPETVLQYLVNETGTLACLQGNLTKQFNDIFYSISSSTGALKEGKCEPYTTPGGETPPPEEPPPTPTPTPNPSQGPDKEPPLTQMPQLSFRPTYSPQNNKLEFCYRVEIAFNPDYMHASLDASYVWEYKIDTSEPPFWGLNPSVDLSSSYGYTTKSYDANTGVWVLAGEGWNNTLSDSSGGRTVGFCASRVPEPALVKEAYSVSPMTHALENNVWWACLDFHVSSTSEYPIPWEVEVDLKDYFANTDGKQFQFSRVNMLPLGGTKYRFSGTEGNNKYVSASWPRDLSRFVCYSPGGQAWSK